MKIDVWMSIKVPYLSFHLVWSSRPGSPAATCCCIVNSLTSEIANWYGRSAKAAGEPRRYWWVTPQPPEMVWSFWEIDVEGRKQSEFKFGIHRVTGWCKCKLPNRNECFWWTRQASFHRRLRNIQIQTTNFRVCIKLGFGDIPYQSSHSCPKLPLSLPTLHPYEGVFSRRSTRPKAFSQLRRAKYSELSCVNTCGQGTYRLVADLPFWRQVSWKNFGYYHHMIDLFGQKEKESQK